MNTKWIKISIILAAMSGLATLTFNCSPSAFSGAKFSGSTEASSTSSNAFAAVDSPYSQMTMLQQFQAMLNVTGQAKAMTATQAAEYALRTGALAGTNSLTSVNGPLLIAATSLAGEVCNGMMATEITEAASLRTFYGSVDFGQPLTGTTASQFLQTAQNMAIAFYGRSLTSDETGILGAYYTSFIGDTTISQTDTNQTKALYLGLCAAMLSSFDAQTF